MTEYDRFVILAAAERCELHLWQAEHCDAGWAVAGLGSRPGLLREFAAQESALAFDVARNGSSLLLPFPASAN